MLIHFHYLYMNTWVPAYISQSESTIRYFVVVFLLSSVKSTSHSNLYLIHTKSRNDFNVQFWGKWATQELGMRISFSWIHFIWGIFCSNFSHEVDMHNAGIMEIWASIIMIFYSPMDYLFSLILYYWQ